MSERIPSPGNPPEAEARRGQPVRLAATIGNTALKGSIERQSSLRRELPTGRELEQLVAAELALSVPGRARLAQPGEHQDALIDPGADIDSPDLLPELQQQFIDRNAMRLSTPWWARLEARLSSNDHGAQPIKLLNKYILEVKYQGGQTDQGYDLFTVGEEPPTQEELETVFDTIKLIDQTSGGLASIEEARKPIVIGTGLEDVSGNVTAGFYSEDLTFINMSRIREVAAERGWSLHDTLSIAIVHEVLGHQLEHLVAGSSGGLFLEHFEYSDVKRPSESGEYTVHDTITPKEGHAAESLPVREYGGATPGEDFATSVESSIGAAMGWADAVSHRQDPYRRDLVMSAMQLAAERSRNNQGVPGIYGSELIYTEDAAGDLQVAPARQLEIRSVSPDEALQEEIVKLTEPARSKAEIVVGITSPEDDFWL